MIHKNKLPKYFLGLFFLIFLDMIKDKMINEHPKALSLPR